MTSLNSTSRRSIAGCYPRHLDHGVREGLAALLENNGRRVRTVCGTEWIPSNLLRDENLWAELAS